MTALEDLVEPLKRELAVPGTFDTVFPNSSDDDLQAALADGFAEAQLYGFFPTISLVEDPDGVWNTDPDLSAAGGALILTFTAVRTIRAQLRALTSNERYKAGPVEYETSRAATLLKGELDYLTQKLKDLIDQGQQASNASARLATVFDNYVARTSLSLCGGFYPYELVG